MIARRLPHFLHMPPFLGKNFLRFTFQENLGIHLGVFGFLIGPKTVEHLF